MFSKRDLRRLLIPLIVEQFLAVLVGMVDVVMVAGVGEAAVSGVSLVDAINLLLIQLLGAMATGGAVVAGQYLGCKNEERACRAANQLLLVTTVISAAIMVIALVGNRVILSVIFGKIDADVMADASLYFYITSLSFPFLAMYNSCAALYRAMGNSKVSMKTSLVMNGINIAGNAIGVYVLRVGVAGVAVPTLISRMVAAVIMLVIIRNEKNQVHVDKHLRLGYEPDMIRQILRIGIPSGMESSMFQLGKIMVQSLVSSLGTVAIAGFAVATNLASIEYLPGQAIGLGLVTVASQCVGAKEFGQVKEYTKKLVLLDYSILIGIIVVIDLLHKPIIGIYNLSPEAAAIAAGLIVFHGFAMLFWPPAFIVPNALRAASDVTFTMVIAVASMWLFRICLAYLMVKVFHTGVIGIWIAMSVDWIFRFVVFLWRMISGKWIRHGSDERLKRKTV
ncbi:MATE family efflux transporter [Qiania dongpingensis]|uniref:Probable multidrug resistance protein NorM n=1 Tax=Qiania dongpingensis TaxID=2763669 RepID=A0A7G9G348_9FIRM|nr:MATE family efflux transporter [Qiania dongpingensis]QNM05230.1 MATE family efflux transporter [Qiania dongpingensis]